MIPILFHLGRLPIRSYGVAMALAFAVGIWLARRRAKANGLDPDVIIDFAFFVILASIAGARAAYVIVHWTYFQLDPLAAFRIWDGGLTQYGGIAAGFLVGLIFFARRGIDPWRGADVVAPSLALGIAIGRVGCFLNGCCFGQACARPWAATFPPESVAGTQFPGVAVHPTQLYATIAALVILAVLLAVERRKPFEGFLTWLFVILLSVYRFLIDPIRYYEPMSMVRKGEGWHVSSNQAMGIVLVLIAAGFMAYLSRRARAAQRS